MIVSDFDVAHIEGVMRAAKEKIETLKRENQRLISALVREKTDHEALRNWVRIGQS